MEKHSSGNVLHAIFRNQCVMKTDRINRDGIGMEYVFEFDFQYVIRIVAHVCVAVHYIECTVVLLEQGVGKSYIQNYFSRSLLSIDIFAFGTWLGIRGD